MPSDDWKKAVKKETLEDMPRTLKRSPEDAQETWARTHDSAVETYGEGERAHRTAYASLKHSFEKVGDHWERKKRGKGPSDPRAEQPTPQAAQGEGRTFGGIDVYGHTREELLERARGLDVRGRTRMSKEELAEAILKKERSRQARSR